MMARGDTNKKIAISLQTFVRTNVLYLRLPGLTIQKASAPPIEIPTIDLIQLAIAVGQKVLAVGGYSGKKVKIELIYLTCL
jgi:hypothetical protein